MAFTESGVLFLESKVGVMVTVRYLDWSPNMRYLPTSELTLPCPSLKSSRYDPNNLLLFQVLNTRCRLLAQVGAFLLSESSLNY